MTEYPPYCLVSPVRDEERFIRRTLDAVVNQSVPPALWVIVDDGSSDATPAILADYAARWPFILVIRRNDRGERSVGPGVVEAFNDGWAIARSRGHAVLGKLDMDLDLPRDYFERLLGLMAADPRLGTVSGKAYVPTRLNPHGNLDGPLVSEHVGDDVSLGMTKLWRRTCFDDIGGLAPQLLWDVLDCHMARRLGWKAYSTDDPRLRFVHMRPMGSSHRGILTGRRRWGRGLWIAGYSPLFVAVTILNRARHRPFVLGGAAMLWGYLAAAIVREPRRGTAGFRRYLRAYQHVLLRHGRHEAVRRYEQAGEAAWLKRHGQAASDNHKRSSAADLDRTAGMVA